MQPTINTPAKDFNTLTSERTYFTFSRLKGTPLVLSFYTNEAFAICNSRLQALKKYTRKLTGKDVTIISVFRSMPKDILEFAGKSESPFFMLADPMGLIYDLYSIQAGEKKVINGITSETKTLVMQAAAKSMFAHSSKGNNVFKLSADFFIDTDFIIRKINYANDITDFLSVNEISEWVSGQHYSPLHNAVQIAKQSHKNKVA